MQQMLDNDAKSCDRFLAGKDGHLNYQVLLQKLFFLIAVLPSLECGLIPKKKLVLSGDGILLSKNTISATLSITCRSTTRTLKRIFLCFFVFLMPAAMIPSASF